MDSNDSLKEQRDYAWLYFQLHANQRMTSFNFFVVIAALLTTGFVGTLKKDFEYYYLGYILAMSLVIISFIFWKMDQRIRYLIKHAEEALKAIEEKWISNEDEISSKVALFKAEEEKTENIRNLGSWNLWRKHLSYADCFGVVYLIFGVFGIVAIITSWLA